MFRISAYDMRDQLEDFGIDILTGEADSIGIRLLCDLNQTGIDIMTEYTGGLIPTKPGYNSGIKSCFITREEMKNILIFALLREDNNRIIADCTPLSGYERDVNPIIYVFESDSEFNSKGQPISLNGIPLNQYYNYRLYRVYGKNRRGLSNIHAMSGRSQ